MSDVYWGKDIHPPVFWLDSRFKTLSKKLGDCFSLINERSQAALNAGGSLDFKGYIRLLDERGLSGLRYSVAQGGTDDGLWSQALFAERLGHVISGAVGMGLTIHYDMVAPVIAAHGNTACQQRFLKPALRGELLFSHAVSEASAGSDFSNISCTAQRHKGGWLLNGTKTMISLATAADVHFVLARLPEKKAPFNMVILLVPSSLKGVSVGPEQATMGNKGCPVADIHLDNVWVDDDCRLGAQGLGFVIQLQQFVQERIVSSLRANAAARRGLDRLISHTQERLVADQRLIDRDSWQHKIADLESDWAKCRALTYQALEAWAEGLPYESLSSASKLLSSRLVRRVARTALHAGGVNHYQQQSELAQLYTDSRLFSISTGSDEMMLTSLI
ncbi:acyl-CoA dehydrogenase family protein, partial [Thalassotalea sp. G20_0]|uniref:acyl-CoA dehydrogenase family protein n=1 Tax=Thalassotalea sp. G20_0 TaxID=2821093 RepID=UPI001ADC3F44